MVCVCVAALAYYYSRVQCALVQQAGIDRRTGYAVGNTPGSPWYASVVSELAKQPAVLDLFTKLMAKKE